MEVVNGKREINPLCETIPQEKQLNEMTTKKSYCPLNTLSKQKFSQSKTKIKAGEIPFRQPYLSFFIDA